jgi:hypothetical protein
MSQRKGRVAVVAVASVAAVVGLAGGANAAGNPSIPDGSVTGADVRDGSLYQSDINSGVVTVLRTPGQNSVSSWNVKNGGLYLEDFHASAKAGLKGAKGDKGDPGGGLNGDNLLYMLGGENAVFSIVYDLSTEIPLGPGNSTARPLTYFYQHLAGDGTKAPNVMFEVDANNNGKCDGDPVKWLMGGFKPGDMGGDRVMQMDGATTSAGQSGMGTAEQWYVSNADNTGWNEDLYGSFNLVVDRSGLLTIAGAGVCRMRILVGGSNAWDGDAYIVNPVFDPYHWKEVWGPAPTGRRVDWTAQ